jgi:hypothetical protein
MGFLKRLPARASTAKTDTMPECAKVGRTWT